MSVELITISAVTIQGISH